MAEAAAGTTRPPAAGRGREGPPTELPRGAGPSLSQAGPTAGSAWCSITPDPRTGKATHFSLTQLGGLRQLAVPLWP